MLGAVRLVHPSSDQIRNPRTKKLRLRRTYGKRGLASRRLLDERLDQRIEGLRRLPLRRVSRAGDRLTAPRDVGRASEAK